MPLTCGSTSHPTSARTPGATDGPREARSGGGGGAMLPHANARDGSSQSGDVPQTALVLVFRNRCNPQCHHLCKPGFTFGPRVTCAGCSDHLLRRSRQESLWCSSTLLHADAVRWHRPIGEAHWRRDCSSFSETDVMCGPTICVMRGLHLADESPAPRFTSALLRVSSQRGQGQTPLYCDCLGAGRRTGLGSVSSR